MSFDQDKSLNINTRGVITAHSDKDHYICQSTYWHVLDKLAQSGYVTEDNTVVDYGSGKGRVAFFLNNAIGCPVVGVEFAEEIYNMAESNLDSYGRGKGVSFVHSEAEDYEPDGADTFYFFNPFSLETVKKVTDKILATETAKRLIFYYPPVEVEKYFKTVPRLALIDEIDCRLVSNDNEQNKLMVFDIREV